LINYSEARENAICNHYVKKIAGKKKEIQMEEKAEYFSQIFDLNINVGHMIYGNCCFL